MLSWHDVIMWSELVLFCPCRCTDMFASIHAAIVNTSCETHQETLNKLITDYKTIIPVGFCL